MGSSPTPGFAPLRRCRAILAGTSHPGPGFGSSLGGPDREPDRYGPAGARESRAATGGGRRELQPKLNPAWMDRWPVETYA